MEIINKALFSPDRRQRTSGFFLDGFEEKLLARPEFIKVHRSYIVNLWQVNELRAKELITSRGKAVPISRLLYGKVREAYMRHLFLEKEVDQ